MDLVHGPLPTDWLIPTGRVPAVLAAWEHGALAEVPTGLAWDVVRIPTGTAWETVRQFRSEKVPIGPVLATPLGVDFFVARGSADEWDAEDSSRLPDHTLALLPHPVFVEPYRVGARSWVVPPTSSGALALGPDLYRAYQVARACAAQMQMQETAR